jgi:small subunit ribosomal protein S4
MLIIKSKYKVAKRLGAGIFEQTQTQKFALSEARSKRARGRGQSDYGRQLLEKQKVRYTYGLSERQLGKYAAHASAEKDPSASLHRLLEMRADNVVYRAGFAATRRAGRQMVSHGHMLVNGRRITTPSYEVRKGDVLTVREGSRKNALFAPLGDPEREQKAVPHWLSTDANLMRIEVTGGPQYSAVEVGLDYPTVFEFYSR